MPGIENSRLFISSMRRRLFSISGASRRRMPRLSAHLRIGGVLRVHVVALFVGDHLQRQLVVVAEEDRPLARRRDFRRLVHDLDDRMRAPPAAAPMNMRGISGKWNAMWHSSPSPK